MPSIRLSALAAAFILITSPTMVSAADGDAGATPMTNDAVFKAFHGQEGGLTGW